MTRKSMKAPTVKVGELGLDHSARIQCVLAFDVTWDEVSAMPVEHITMTELPHGFNESEEGAA